LQEFLSAGFSTREGPRDACTHALWTCSRCDFDASAWRHWHIKLFNFADASHVISGYISICICICIPTYVYDIIPCICIWWFKGRLVEISMHRKSMKLKCLRKQIVM
jgi:hypothetical protein